MPCLISIISVYLEPERLADQLQCAPRATAHRIYYVHSGLVFARPQRRRLKNKPMPIILGALPFMHIRPKLIGGSIRGKLIVDEERHLDPIHWMTFVHYPAADCFLIRLVQNPADIQVGGSKIERHSHGCNQEGL